jgi:hypothetical protein
MNLLLRIYIAAGITFILSVYIVTLAVWFDATLNGLYNGQYVVAVNTNALGENDLELALLFFFIPVVSWVFTRGLRGVIRKEPAL